MKKLQILGILLVLFSTNGYTQEKVLLSLQQAQEMVLQKNPLLHIQEHHINWQQGLYWSEMLPQNPEIGVEYEEVPQGQSYSHFGERKIFISQQIEFPTNYIFKHQVLRAEIKQEQLRLEEVRRELVFQVTEAYYNVLLHQKLVKLAQDNLILSQDFYDKAQRSYELGETNRLTMLKAKVNLGIAQKQLDGAEKDMEVAHSKLRHILATKHYENIAYVTTDTLPEILPPFSYEKAMPLVRNHPALQRAAIARNAAAAANHLSYNRLLPDISISYYRQTVGVTDFWGGEIGISLPLWFMGAKGQIQKTSAMLEISKYALVDEQLRLKKEFDQAAGNFDKAVNEVNLYQNELVSEAEEAFRIAQNSYAVGELGYLEFIDAQKTLIQTREGFYQALYNYQVERANIIKLTGEK